MKKQQRTAIIIGAGPAGLTAAYELCKRTDIHPIVLEANPTYVGGISKTVVYKGNRIDIGGHRFFSKSDRVMNWWLEALPLADEDAANAEITYHNKTRSITAASPTTAERDPDHVMLLRKRLSRIYYNGTFFPYPLDLSIDTLRKLGLVKIGRIGVTYLYRKVAPIRPEESLEAFFTNRFGDELYRTFFKTYTEKVWGKPCAELSAAWGAQRVKGLSVTKTVTHAISKQFKRRDVAQKDVETSLIERFLYPKYGPGHLWNVLASRVRSMGGEIRMGEMVTKFDLVGDRVSAVHTRDTTGATHRYACDVVISSMPIRYLIRGLGAHVPRSVQQIAQDLQYRDFITVGLLLDKSRIAPDIAALEDTWLYVHEPGVELGRIQLFHNWSPHLVSSDEHLWFGLEYFCNQGDALWSRSDAEMIALATSELATLGLVEPDAVLDGTVLREPKAYPVYAGSYAQFNEVRTYLDTVENLFPVGRNGTHKYNNQDHSMLTAMAVVDELERGSMSKQHVWDINTEQEYHEERTSASNT